jgi:hypothetical protein
MDLASRQLSKRIFAAALAVLGLVCLLAVAASSTSAKPRMGVGKARVVKPGQTPTMYWGAWIGNQITGTGAPYDMNAVQSFAGAVGKPLSIVEWAVPFADCSQPTCSFFNFPTTPMQSVRDYGAIPMLSWSSASIGAGVDAENQPDFQLSDVTSGRYDDYIRSFAIAARDWGHPFFLRFDWEMNGNWFPWNVLINGNHPEDFVPAWRHVHDIFTSVGANNATWVWCPYVDASSTYKNVRQLYPGAGYVDWTCLDVYNWAKAPANPHPWRTFAQLFDHTYDRYGKLAPNKPLMIGEMASSDFGGNKAAWIRDFFKRLWRYTRVRALVYFDVNDRGTHWPIETSSDVLSAFARGISKPSFLSNGFGDLSTSPIPPPAG